MIYQLLKNPTEQVYATKWQVLRLSQKIWSSFLRWKFFFFFNRTCKCSGRWFGVKKMKYTNVWRLKKWRQNVAPNFAMISQTAGEHWSCCQFLRREVLNTPVFALTDQWVCRVFLFCVFYKNHSSQTEQDVLRVPLY